MIKNESKQEIFERYIIGLTAIVVGFTIAIISILGTLGLDIIKYASSESAITQGMGQDLVNLVFITPLCLIGGVLYISKRENAKYFLILIPLYSLLYTGHPKLIILLFNECINNRDVQGLSNLMTEDHKFIDRKNKVTAPKEKMVEWWL